MPVTHTPAFSVCYTMVKHLMPSLTWKCALTEWPSCMRDISWHSSSNSALDETSFIEMKNRVLGEFFSVQPSWNVFSFILPCLNCLGYLNLPQYLNLMTFPVLDKSLDNSCPLLLWAEIFSTSAQMMVAINQNYCSLHHKMICKDTPKPHTEIQNEHHMVSYHINKLWFLLCWTNVCTLLPTLLIILCPPPSTK